MGSLFNAFVCKYKYIRIYVHISHHNLCICLLIYLCDSPFFEGSFEVKLPTIWTDGKAEVGRVREEKRKSEKIKEEKEWEERRCRYAKKVGKSRFTEFFQWFGLRGSKSTLPKAVGAEPAGQMRDEKLHAVVARSTFPSQKCKKTDGFGPLLEVEKSTKCTPVWCEAHFQFPSQKC